MTKPISISVFAVVGSPYCVASGDGEKVFELLANGLREGKSVVLSFRNVTALTSAFLNAAVGQLYGVIPESRIPQLLSVEDIAPDDEELLRRVVETAKEYFKDPDKYEAAVREALEEGEDVE